MVIVSAVFVLLMTICVIGIAENTMMRSTSLRTRVTNDGDSVRIDYINDEDKITFAADKQYATIIKTKGLHSELEQYYDEAGNPAKQSMWHYALLREYNEEGQTYKITYLGQDEKPILNRVGYAVSIRKYDDAGRISLEEYFNADGEPIQTKYWGHGYRRDYDEKGRIIAVTYIDLQGHPVITSQGFATVKQTFYEDGDSKGLVKEKRYYDDKGNPVALYRGQFGILTVYDEYGRGKEITFLGVDGNIMVNTEGYATVKKTYYPDDTVCTELYYDQYDRPVALSEGQYGTYYKDNQTIYLDINSNELYNVRNELYNNRWIAFVLCLTLIIISALTNTKVNLVMFVLYICFTIYMTLLYRTHTGQRLELRLFWSYSQFFVNDKIRWQILENILLFIPLGAMLYSLYPSNKSMFVLIGISVAIELLQFVSSTGLCEFDDVISNSLGGWIGICTQRVTARIRLRIKK